MIVYRGDPAHSRGTLVVTWWWAIGISGLEWQSGAKHGIALFHWLCLPEGQTVSIPEGQ